MEGTAPAPKPAMAPPMPAAPGAWGHMAAIAAMAAFGGSIPPGLGPLALLSESLLEPELELELPAPFRRLDFCMACIICCCCMAWRCICGPCICCIMAICMAGFMPMPPMLIIAICICCCAIIALRICTSGRSRRLDLSFPFRSAFSDPASRRDAAAASGSGNDRCSRRRLLRCSSSTSSRRRRRLRTRERGCSSERTWNRASGERLRLCDPGGGLRPRPGDRDREQPLPQERPSGEKPPRSPSRPAARRWGTPSYRARVGEGEAPVAYP